MTFNHGVFNKIILLKINSFGVFKKYFWNLPFTNSFWKSCSALIDCQLSVTHHTHLKFLYVCWIIMLKLIIVQISNPNKQELKSLKVFAADTKWRLGGQLDLFLAPFILIVFFKLYPNINYCIYNFFFKAIELT